MAIPFRLVAALSVLGVRHVALCVGAPAVHEEPEPSRDPTCAATSAAETCQRRASSDARLGTESLLMQIKHSQLLKLKHDLDAKTKTSAEDCCSKCGANQFCSPVSGNCYDRKKKKYYHTCPKSSCCDKCGDTGFCSPISGNCYDKKRKDYYETCEAPSRGPEEPEEPSQPEPIQTCCSGCLKGAPAFCSPKSGSCYTAKVKDYYQSCPEGGDLEVSMPVVSKPAEKAGSIKFMSYNLYGWNAFNANKWRSEVILGKIKAWGPAVLGAQEVETGGSKGYGTVRNSLVDATGLAEAGGSQFFQDSSLEKLASIDYIPLVRGYWLSFAKYKQKSTGVTFLFFNSHWKHGYGRQQAEIVAKKVAELRKEHGALPTVLVGDTNQFCRAYERSGIKYLKGETGDSPVIFDDAIEQDQGKSFSDKNNPDCRVDFILASRGDWKLVTSFIDRHGMGSWGSASDHAALMAELVPFASSRGEELVQSLTA